MASITIVGNISFEPELKEVNGTPVCNLVISESRKNTKTDKYDYQNFNVAVWGQQANFVTTYFHKGSPIMIIGETTEIGVYEKQDGTVYPQVKVRAHSASFMPRDFSEAGKQKVKADSLDDMFA